jgi:GTPase SAR1 family protein
MESKRRTTFDKLIKLVLIGDSSVGKTCLLLRFSDNKFPQDHMPTIGIDFKIKMLQIGDTRVKL